MAVTLVILIHDCGDYDKSNQIKLSTAGLFLAKKLIHTNYLQCIVLL